MHTYSHTYMYNCRNPAAGNSFALLSCALRVYVCMYMCVFLRGKAFSLTSWQADLRMMIGMIDSNCLCIRFKWIRANKLVRQIPKCCEWVVPKLHLPWLKICVYPRCTYTSILVYIYIYMYMIRTYTCYTYRCIMLEKPRADSVSSLGKPAVLWCICIFSYG